MEGCTSAGVLAGWSIVFRLKCITNLNSQQEGGDLFTVYLLRHSKGKWAGWLAGRSFLIHKNSNVVPRCKREGARVRTPNSGQGAIAPSIGRSQMGRIGAMAGHGHVSSSG